MARQRRRSGEVRDLLLTAAIDEFAANGYAGASVQSIADRAGLTVSSVYRHFADKADLFTHAVLRPFLTFFDDFSATWQAQRRDRLGDEALMRAMIEDLYDALTAQRNALLEVASGREHLSDELLGEIRKMSTRMFLELKAIGEEEAAARKTFSAEHVEMALRLTVAMVTSMSVFDVWLVPSFPRPMERDQLIEHMTRYAFQATTAHAMRPESLNRPARSAA